MSIPGALKEEKKEVQEEVQEMKGGEVYRFATLETDELCRIPV